MSIRIVDHISKISKRIRPISFRIWILVETAFQMDQPGLIDWMSVVFCPVGKLLHSYGVIRMAGDGLQNWSLQPYRLFQYISSGEITKKYDRYLISMVQSCNRAPFPRTIRHIVFPAVICMRKGSLFSGGGGGPRGSFFKPFGARGDTPCLVLGGARL